MPRQSEGLALARLLLGLGETKKSADRVGGRSNNRNIHTLVGWGAKLFASWTDSRIEMQFGSMKNRPPFEAAELLLRLNDIPSVQIEPTSLAGYPNIPFAALRPKDSLEEFFEAKEWVISVVEKEEAPKIDKPFSHIAERRVFTTLWLYVPPRRYLACKTQGWLPMRVEINGCSLSVILRSLFNRRGSYIS